MIQRRKPVIAVIARYGILNLDLGHMVDIDQNLFPLTRLEKTDEHG
jgi:hypothetical protein